MQGNVKRNVKRNCAIFSIASKTKKAMCESLILCGLSKFFKNARRYGIKKSRPAGSPGQPQVADQQPQVGHLLLAQSGYIRQGPVVPPQQDRMSGGGGGDPGGSALPAGADAAWQLNPTKTGKPCGLPVGSRVNQRLCQTGKRGITASSSAHRKRTGPWGQ